MISGMGIYPSSLKPGISSVPATSLLASPRTECSPMLCYRPEMAWIFWQMPVPSDMRHGLLS